MSVNGPMPAVQCSSKDRGASPAPSIASAPRAAGWIGARRAGERDEGVEPASEAISRSETSDSTLFSTTFQPSASLTSTASSCSDEHTCQQNVNDAVYLAASPGRGMGLFAARPLQPGERILCEPPLVTLRSRQDLPLAIRALPVGDQRVFYALANAYEDDETTTTECGIFDTNAFSLSTSTSPSSTPSTAGGYGIFALSSRLNHSCRPNVKASYCPSTGLLQTHVLRPIPAGEELLTSYLGGTTLFATPTAERRALLHRGWAFTCHCEACTGTAEERTASDARRTELAALQARIPSVRPRDVDRALRDAARALHLLRVEQLPLDGPEWFALRAARACAWHKDLGGASAWAAVGWESARRAYGVGSEGEGVLREAMERPRGLVPSGHGGERRGLFGLTRELLGEWRVAGDS